MTIEEQLQRILQTKTGFKDLITEKGGVITETTTFHEYIDEARKLMEGGKVVVEEVNCTAVPNEGYVDKVYFNTSLSSEEVENIIVNANLVPHSFEGYILLKTNDNDIILVMDAAVISQGQANGVMIMATMYPEQGIFVSPSMASMMGSAWSGWNPNFNGVLEIQKDVLTASESTGNIFGAQNEALKELISSTAFKSGKQPVPNSGYIESVKFNTSLTPEEVDSLLNNVFEGYDWQSNSYMHYVTYFPDKMDYNVVISPATGNGHNDWAILIGSMENPIYISPSLADMGTPISGWSPNFDGTIILGYETISKVDGFAIGAQNAALTDLVYIGTDLFKKELTGTYEAVTVDVTENSEVDLTEYWDNSEMPVKVNVNVEASDDGEPEITYVPVPNEGYVEKIYFNISLTPEEVDKIITDANLEWANAEGTAIYNVIRTDVLGSEEGEQIVISNMYAATGTVGYIIAQPMNGTLIYISSSLSGLGEELPFTSWNPDLVNNNGIYEIGYNVVNIDSGYSGDFPVGIQNDALKELVYVDKLVDGNGYAEVISTAEEMEANLTAENKHKFYLYNGEDGQYTNGEYYAVVDDEETVVEEDRLKNYFTFINKTENIFSDVQSIPDGLIKYNDLENVTNISYMFRNNTWLQSIPLFNTKNALKAAYFCNRCEKLTEIPKYDFSNVTDLSQAFGQCKSLTYFPDLNINNVEKVQSMFYQCYKLVTIEKINLDKVVSSSYGSLLSDCPKIENINFLNIRLDLQIGSGTTYGHLLTVDSLINTCKECINAGGARTLTMGSANIEKLANVYVKFVDSTQTTIDVDTKGEVEVCESTDTGAMTINDYMALKNWSLA